MKNKKIKTLVIASIIGVILLSGCVNNDTKTNTTANKTPSETPMQDITKTNITGNVLSETKTNITTNLSVKSENSTLLTSTELDWCKAGVTTTENGKQYTVQGVETLNGTEMCKASYPITGGETVRYWNKDKTIVSEKSVSVSKNGSASASSSSNVNI